MACEQKCILRWFMEHPWTIGYIAFVATINCILLLGLYFVH